MGKRNNKLSKANILHDCILMISNRRLLTSLLALESKREPELQLLTQVLGFDINRLQVFFGELFSMLDYTSDFSLSFVVQIKY